MFGRVASMLGRVIEPDYFVAFKRPIIIIANLLQLQIKSFSGEYGVSQKRTTTSGPYLNCMVINNACKFLSQLVLLAHTCIEGALCKCCQKVYSAI